MGETNQQKGMLYKENAYSPLNYTPVFSSNTLKFQHKYLPTQQSYACVRHAQIGQTEIGAQNLSNYMQMSVYPV